MVQPSASPETRSEREAASEDVPEEVVVVSVDDFATMWGKTFQEDNEVYELVDRVKGVSGEASDWIWRMLGLTRDVTAAKSIVAEHQGEGGVEEFLDEQMREATAKFLMGNLFAAMGQSGDTVLTGAEVKFRAKSEMGAVNDRLLRVGKSEGNVAQVDLTEFLTLSE